MNLNFREGNTKDLKQLREVALASYGVFEKELTKENWEIFFKNLDSEDSYTHILKISKCFVCEMDDKIVGVAYFVPSGNPTEIFEASWSYLRMVGVHPDYQGNGIGHQLTQLCIEFAKQSNEQVIALHTSEFMNSARYVYEKLGFKKIKELQPLFGKKYWLYQMMLS
ncbi:MAG: GNAT family N-acetyltransferase [Saprospiraceae bacterium]